MSNPIEKAIGEIDARDSEGYLLRQLLRYALKLDMRPRFTDLASLKDRCFPFEPMLQKIQTPDASRYWLECAIVDSMITAIACQDIKVAFRAFYVGMKEIGTLQGEKLGTNVIPLSAFSDMEHCARNRIEKALER